MTILLLMTLLCSALFSSLAHSSAEHNNRVTIAMQQFESPVKNKDVVAAYNTPSFRRVHTEHIPEKPLSLRRSLTRKAKQGIAKFKSEAGTNGIVARDLSVIYAALPKGDSPVKKKHTKNKKSDTANLNQIISTAAAVGQLIEKETNDSSMREEIDSQVRKIRTTVQANPVLASPVHSPITTFFASHKPLSPAPTHVLGKENAENIPPTINLAPSAQKPLAKKPAQARSIMQPTNNQSSQTLPVQPFTQAIVAASVPKLQDRPAIKKAQSQTGQKRKPTHPISPINTKQRIAKNAPISEELMLKERKKTAEAWGKASTGCAKINAYYTKR